MEKSKQKKISLTNHAMWTALYWTVLLFTQLVMIYMNTELSGPIFLGPIYVPLLIDTFVLVLLAIAIIIFYKKTKQREKNDELADFNQYKAGYITKYILVFVLAVIVLSIKDFTPFYTDDIIGNIGRTFLICLSINEIIQNIVFIILEKNNLE